MRTGKFGCQLFWLHWQTAIRDATTAKVEKSSIFVAHTVFIYSSYQGKTFGCLQNYYHISDRFQEVPFSYCFSHANAAETNHLDFTVSKMNII